MCVTIFCRFTLHHWPLIMTVGVYQTHNRMSDTGMMQEHNERVKRLHFNIGPSLGPLQRSVMCVTFWISFFILMIVIPQFLWIEHTNFDNTITCWALYIKVHEPNLKQSKIIILSSQLPGKRRYVCHLSFVMCVTSLDTAYITRDITLIYCFFILKLLWVIFLCYPRTAVWNTH